MPRAGIATGAAAVTLGKDTAAIKAANQNP
jgi:hypothetical protein